LVFRCERIEEGHRGLAGRRIVGGKRTKVQGPQERLSRRRYSRQYWRGLEYCLKSCELTDVRRTSPASIVQITTLLVVWIRQKNPKCVDRTSSTTRL
jgi:hypothetical protein